MCVTFSSHMQHRIWSCSFTTWLAKWRLNERQWSPHLLKQWIWKYFTGYLTDEHILELSKRITDSEELMDLGIRVLKLPESKLRAELYNQHNWIQGATLAALSTWLKHQNTRQEAYRNLCDALTKAEMNHLASELRTWVGGAAESSGVSCDCKFE